MILFDFFSTSDLLRMLARIQHRNHIASIPVDTVIDPKREGPCTKPVERTTGSMRACIQPQRINIGINRVREICANTGFTVFVEIIAASNIAFRRGLNPNLH